MPEPIGTAYVAIRPDGSTFASDLQTQTQPGIDNLKKQLLTIGVGLGLAVGIKDAFQQLTQGQAVAAQTKTRLDDLGSAATVSAQHVADLADSLQEVSGTNQNTIQSAENLILTFHDIQNAGTGVNAIFDRTTKAAVDLSAAGFGDVTNTAKQLGKALEDPSVGMTALRRVGVTFTSAQVDVIKKLQDTGDLLDAEKLILDQVESKVGGAAAAYGNTLGGQLDKAKASLLETGAAILQVATPALTGLAHGAGSVAAAFESLPAAVQAGVVAFIALKVAIDSSIGQALISTIAEASQNFAAFFALVGTEGVSAFELLGTSAVATTAAFAVPAVGLLIISNRVKDLNAASKQLQDQLQTKIDTSSYDDYNRLLQEINDQQKKDQGTSIFGIGSAESSKEIGDLKAAGETIERLAGQSLFLASATGQNTDETSKWLEKQDQLGNVFSSNSDALAAYTKYLQSFSGALSDAQKATVSADDSLADAALAYRKSQQDLNDAIEAEHSLHLQNEQDANAVTSAQFGLIDAQTQLNQALGEGAKLARDLVEAQDDQLSASLDLADAQQQLAADERGYQTTITDTSYAGSVHKSTAEQIARDQIAVSEAQNKLADAGDVVTQAQQAQANQSYDVAKAQLAVKNASVQLATAQQKVNDEATAQSKAQLAVAEATQQVKDDGDKLAIAQQQDVTVWNNLTGAIWNAAAAYNAFLALEGADLGEQLNHRGIAAPGSGIDPDTKHRVDTVAGTPNRLSPGNPNLPGSAVAPGVVINQTINGTSTEQALKEANSQMMFALSGLWGTS